MTDAELVALLGLLRRMIDQVHALEGCLETLTEELTRVERRPWAQRAGT